MKSTSKLIIFVITFLALTASVYAQSPREQLNQMVQQLQKTPNESALREKIIKLARTMKPTPALPDTAIAFEGRAQFAFRNAKSEGDFLAAAQEYEKAVAAAPWVPGYYADLCTIYEKAGKYEDAKRHCGFYLIGLTDPAQMTGVKRRIAGLEFGIEKANSPQTAKAAKPAGADFSGCWQGPDTAGTQYCEFSFERNGDNWIVRGVSQKPLRILKMQGRQLLVEDNEYDWVSFQYDLTLSEDGQTIDRAKMDTQSPEQFNRMNSRDPGGRLTYLNQWRRGTPLRRK
ncbi:MAG: hypothetical protein NUV55_02995 [Sulfuricaulis sp.]|uniref:tetratricopeptide repeat protein n=1 Tax=Sulfuricaulis sp. TaxID=2003553 RepID=UPI0025D5E045|nr:hypothetical protein [Sulfuricaulis sp.]MCR4346162.1 hypothetical protein [Sulfuricaulis sp.]